MTAWQDIADEGLNLDDVQQRQLEKNLSASKSALKESVWRTYRYLMLLGKDNAVHCIYLGMPTSSSAESLATLILRTLRQTDDMDLRSISDNQVRSRKFSESKSNYPKSFIEKRNLERLRYRKWLPTLM